MKKIYIFILFLCFTVFAFSMSGKMKPQKDKIEYENQLGTVQLPEKYEDSVEGHLKYGLALLHHMTYNEARKEFSKATEADPTCALGYWGQAMTYIHPLWSDPPSEEEFNKGMILIEEAKKYQKGKEVDYIRATESYYAAGKNENEKNNLVAFADGWKKVSLKYPNDPEAASFYALSYLSTADPEDKSYEIQIKVGEITKNVLKIIPDHPGAHHYMIHAYDYPELAPMGLEVSKTYVEIAPEIPHALHMASHIFTRLGLWEESIVMNSRSAEAALKHPTQGTISLHYPHAVDYLIYAHLQKGEDLKAKEALDELMAMEEDFQSHIAASYTFNAAPARLLLERQNWDDAMSLEPWVPVNYGLNKFPAMEAITYFAKGLGAARIGNKSVADKSLQKLLELHDKIEATSPYWAKQIEIQSLSVMAWMTYISDKKKGIEIMKEAAMMEDTTEKHPVTPGEVLPARELYGDMLLDSKQYKEAQYEYQESLKRNKNRLNSLYGAGQAAEMQGDKLTAINYYEKVVDQAKGADTEIVRVQHAKMYLTNNQ
ncbi:hypothetical protein [uncultured Ilyobacter sp.]|uniref:tetratricopeptide repeat protein n=1 Tax=uncultured Ilyobacter sp. TaxID=544433 RepID=UPI002AA67375|nr:hypothetical protein [uncultured Ilyobacter sp.]